jgi:hypothetical protein
MLLDCLPQAGRPGFYGVLDSLALCFAFSSDCINIFETLNNAEHTTNRKAGRFVNVLLFDMLGRAKVSDCPRHLRQAVHSTRGHWDICDRMLKMRHACCRKITKVPDTTAGNGGIEWDMLVAESLALHGTRGSDETLHVFGLAGAARRESLGIRQCRQ